MDKDRTYYYKTSHACDYSYEDYLEFCSDNDITGEDIAKSDSPRFYEWCEEQVDWDNEVDMLQDAIISMAMDMLNKNRDDGDKYKYNDVAWMKCYLSTEAMGWRNIQAESKVMDVEDIYEVLCNFDSIEAYYDEEYGYCIIGSDHDGSNRFDLIIIHEDFIEDMEISMYPIEKFDYLNHEDIVNIENMKKIIKVRYDAGCEYYEIHDIINEFNVNDEEFFKLIEYAVDLYRSE